MEGTDRLGWERKIDKYIWVNECAGRKESSGEEEERSGCGKEYGRETAKIKTFEYY